MAFEIEKKFFVSNFDTALNWLKRDFGDFKKVVKQGFWWCSNYDGITKKLSISEPKINANEVSAIKNIGEFILPEENYTYIRLRIKNNSSYLITFKNKNMVNNIEQNTEYEFDVDFDTFKRIVLYLKDTSFIFYYNIKETWQFKKDNVNIELSKFNDLKNPYIEVEVIGDSEEELNKKLAWTLKSFNGYGLKEEPRFYVELSAIENKDVLKTMILSQYSREGYKILANLINK